MFESTLDCRNARRFLVKLPQFPVLFLTLDQELLISITLKWRVRDFIPALRIPMTETTYSKDRSIRIPTDVSTATPSLLRLSASISVSLSNSENVVL